MGWSESHISLTFQWYILYDFHSFPSLNFQFPPAFSDRGRGTLGTTTFIPLVTAFSDSGHWEQRLLSPLSLRFLTVYTGTTTFMPPLYVYEQHLVIPVRDLPHYHLPPPPQIRYHWNKKVVTNGRSILMQCMFLLFMLCGRWQIWLCHMSWAVSSVDHRYPVS